MNKLALAIILLITLGVQSCGVYSFSGASIDPRIKTISIQFFFDEVGAGPPTLSQQFTEKLRDYFQQNTTLKMVDFGGDIQLEGSITGYNTRPLAARSGGNQNPGFENADVSGQERLTINVGVGYVNVIDETKDFNKSFSFYRDYDPERESLTNNEQEFVDEIIEQIILDIFNATVSDW